MIILKKKTNNMLSVNIVERSNYILYNLIITGQYEEQDSMQPNIKKKLKSINKKKEIKN